MIFSKTLTLYVPHTRTLCLRLWAAHFLGRGTYTMLSRKLRLDPHRNYFFYVIRRKHMKRFLGGSFQLVPSLENDMRQ